MSGLPEPFKQALDEFDRDLFELQRRMAATRGEAEFVGVPETFGKTLERKSTVLDHVRNDLRSIPEKVVEEEAELERHAEELRRRREDRQAKGSSS